MGPLRVNLCALGLRLHGCSLGSDKEPSGQRFPRELAAYGSPKPQPELETDPGISRACLRAQDVHGETVAMDSLVQNFTTELLTSGPLSVTYRLSKEANKISQTHKCTHSFFSLCELVVSQEHPMDFRSRSE